jgi:hypothetical protein
MKKIIKGAIAATAPVPIIQFATVYQSTLGRIKSTCSYNTIHNCLSINVRSNQVYMLLSDIYHEIKLKEQIEIST